MGVQSPWPAVLDDLEQLYASQYLYGQAYGGNFMDILTPPATWTDKNGVEWNNSDVCFGVKSFNIFIVQEAYGWTTDPESPTGEQEFSWGDPNSSYSQMINSSLASWQKIFPRFASYQSLIWIDMYTAKQVQKENPCTDLPAMLMQTGKQMQTFCKGCPGFKFMGTLTEAKPASFFQPYIDTFYGNPQYPLYRNDL